MVSSLYQAVCAELSGSKTCAPAHHIGTTCPPTKSIQFSLYISSHTVKQKGGNLHLSLQWKELLRSERIVSFAWSP